MIAAAIKQRLGTITTPSGTQYALRERTINADMLQALCPARWAGFFDQWQPATDDRGYWLWPNDLQRRFDNAYHARRDPKVFVSGKIDLSSNNGAIQAFCTLIQNTCSDAVLGTFIEFTFPAAREEERWARATTIALSNLRELRDRLGEPRANAHIHLVALVPQQRLIPQAAPILTDTINTLHERERQLPTADPWSNL